MPLSVWPGPTSLILVAMAEQCVNKTDYNARTNTNVKVLDFIQLGGPGAR